MRPTLRHWARATSAPPGVSTSSCTSAPASVSAHGGRFAVEDDRTIPDTTLGVFEHASGMLTEFCLFEANGQPVLGRGAEVELRGTLGTLYANDRGYEIVPERVASAELLDR